MNAGHRSTGLIDFHQRQGLAGCYPIGLELNTGRCGMIRV